MRTLVSNLCLSLLLLSTQVNGQTNTPRDIDIDGQTYSLISATELLQSLQRAPATAQLEYRDIAVDGFLAAQPFAPALRRALPASAFRRIACGTSVGLLIAALGPIFPDWMQTALAGSAVALLSTSFLRDIIWLVREEEDAENRPQDPEDGPRQTEASDR